MLTWIFLFALTLGVAVRLWLAHRQISHVLANRRRVPEPFRRRITTAVHRKAADYTVTKTRFARITTVVDTLILLVWTLGGGLDWLDQLWRAAGWGSLATGTGFVVSVFLIMSIIEIPASLYETFVIEERFGFNRMSRSVFFLDWIKQNVMLLLLGVPLAYGALYLLEKAGDLWWIYVWLMWSAFLLVMIWAYPAVIAPWFNKFSPLRDQALRRRIDRLLQRTGFRSRGVFVMDGSRRSAHGNAYFTGLGRNKRIVFFDTLLDSLKGPEIEAVLAHELGHFHHHHVPKRIAATLAISFAGLALLGMLAREPWFYHQLGVSVASGHAALALFLLVGPVFTFFFHPIAAWSSRRHEYQADLFAVRRANGNALIRALVKLYRENATTLTPDPIHSAFYDSHPPAPLRIASLQSQA